MTKVRAGFKPNEVLPGHWQWCKEKLATCDERVKGLIKQLFNAQYLEDTGLVLGCAFQLTDFLPGIARRVTKAYHKYQDILAIPTNKRIGVDDDMIADLGAILGRELESLLDLLKNYEAIFSRTLSLTNWRLILLQEGLDDNDEKMRGEVRECLEVFAQLKDDVVKEFRAEYEKIKAGYKLVNPRWGQGTACIRGKSYEELQQIKSDTKLECKNFDQKIKGIRSMLTGFLEKCEALHCWTTELENKNLHEKFKVPKGMNKEGWLLGLANSGEEQVQCDARAMIVDHARRLKELRDSRALHDENDKNDIALRTLLVAVDYDDVISKGIGCGDAFQLMSGLFLKEMRRLQRDLTKMLRRDSDMTPDMVEQSWWGLGVIETVNEQRKSLRYWEQYYFQYMIDCLNDVAPFLMTFIQKYNSYSQRVFGCLHAECSILKQTLDELLCCDIITREQYDEYNRKIDDNESVVNNCEQEAQKLAEQFHGRNFSVLVKQIGFYAESFKGMFEKNYEISHECPDPKSKTERDIRQINNTRERLCVKIEYMRRQVMETAQLVERDFVSVVQSIALDSPEYKKLTENKLTNPAELIMRIMPDLTGEILRDLGLPELLSPMNPVGKVPPSLSSPQKSGSQAVSPKENESPEDRMGRYARLLGKKDVASDAKTADVVSSQVQLPVAAAASPAIVPSSNLGAAAQKESGGDNNAERVTKVTVTQHTPAKSRTCVIL